MDRGSVRMYAQCSAMHIGEVIDILKKIRKEQGDIPVAGHNGDGFHIEVMRSDKPLNELSTTFSFMRRKVKIGDGAYKLIRKKNPDTKYVWFW